MNTQQFLLSTGWSWNPPALALCAAAALAYFALASSHARAGYFLAALGAYLLVMVSPLNALADGYLFSAHMVQHIVLLLIVPALLLLSLPRTLTPPPGLRRVANPVMGWAAGVGAMWVWHLPALCNAAVSSRVVYGLQTASLLAAGTLFWWQVIAPRDEHRLPPLGGVLYLFTACTACSVLGIILTFAPVTVCSIYMHPADKLGMLNTIRNGWGLTHGRDQQIGGLLMWVPMCLIYLSAIFAQLARWFSAPAAIHSLPKNA